MLLCVIGCGWKTRAGVSLANVLSVNNVSLFLKKGHSVKDLIMTPGEFLLSLGFYVNALELIKGKLADVVNPVYSNSAGNTISW